jgi:putative endonuclease
MAWRMGASVTTRERGRLGEEIAAAHLQLSGYRILGRNVRCGPLEIDLIATRGSTLAFVEVRLRSSHLHGRPEESVGARKRGHLRHAAERLLASGELPAGTRPRLDVIAIDHAGAALQVRHLAGLGWGPR